jgi:predicted aldo/keto reductase-like oxidoreductase
MMTEAFAFENQQLNEVFSSAIQAAADLGLTVITSAPLMQGRLALPIMAELADSITGASTDAGRAIQFARSTPGVSAVLVGMKQASHVQQNMGLLRHPRMSAEAILALYGRQG